MLVSVFIFTVTADQPTPIIFQTLTSTIKGNLHSRQDGSKVLALHSIPFAQPPVGPLRFKPARILDSLPAQLDASLLPATCMQTPHSLEVTPSTLRIDAEHRTSEDCLYMSLYIPIAQNSSLNELPSRRMPVIVWLAGEGFDFADARQFNGVRLAAQSGAIIVSVQYRVGVFGFLRSSGISSGNQGIWDQLTALEFLNAQIPNFGGDVNRITLAGHFTGAMSISILLTSPALSSRSLFSRAILMSGIATGNWVFEKDPLAKSSTLFNDLGCKSNQTQSIADCVRSIPADQLLEKSGFGWKPTYDGRLVLGEPTQLIKSGLFAANVNDILIGSTQNDGSLCYQIQRELGKAHHLNSRKLKTEHFLNLVKDTASMFYENEEEEERLVSLVKQQISSHVIEDYTSEYINLCTQLLFHNPQQKFQEVVGSRASVLSFKLNKVVSTSTNQLASMPQAGFSDDVLLAFGQLVAVDTAMGNLFARMLGSFAASGQLAAENLTSQNMFNLRKVNQLAKPQKSIEDIEKSTQQLSLGCPKLISNSSFVARVEDLYLQLFQAASLRKYSLHNCPPPSNKHVFFNTFNSSPMLIQVA